MSSRKCLQRALRVIQVALIAELAAFALACSPIPRWSYLAVTRVDAMSDSGAFSAEEVERAERVAAGVAREIGMTPNASTDDQIELERVWRRYQITVAAGRDLDRDLVRALNGWALFSRQAYSRSMAAWPARPLAVDMLEDPRWLKRAQDDLDLVLTSLAELRPFLERSGLLRQLGRGDRLLYDRLSVPGNGDAAAAGGPETVAMSRLVHLLAALNTVVGPGEPWSGDR